MTGENHTDLVERLRKLAERLRPGVDTVSKPETLKLVIEATDAIEALQREIESLEDLADDIARSYGE